MTDALRSAEACGEAGAEEAGRADESSEGTGLSCDAGEEIERRAGAVAWGVAPASSARTGPQASMQQQAMCNSTPLGSRIWFLQDIIMENRW